MSRLLPRRRSILPRVARRATRGKTKRVAALPPANPTAMIMNFGGRTPLLVYSQPSNVVVYVFRYAPKSCCLPQGGPPNPSNPPTGSECPPYGWYWGNDQKCCVPRQPNPPFPQCSYGWEWSSASDRCQPKSTPPSPNNPQPSNHYSGHKRAQKHRANSLCPNGMTACPTVGTYGAFSDYECIDTKHELQSCGGCFSTGAGQDCSAIRGAWNVGCEAGKCAGAFYDYSLCPWADQVEHLAVYNCMAGYRLSANGAACILL